MVFADYITITLFLVGTQNIILHFRINIPGKKKGTAGNNMKNAESNSCDFEEESLYLASIHVHTKATSCCSFQIHL